MHISHGQHGKVILHFDYGSCMEFNSMKELKEFAKNILKLIKEQ